MTRVNGTHIYFGLLETPPRRKTQIWQVISKRGVFLGDVKWYTPWRRYSFYPEVDTIYDDLCLHEITMFIKELMIKKGEGDDA